MFDVSIPLIFSNTSWPSVVKTHLEFFNSFFSSKTMHILTRIRCNNLPNPGNVVGSWHFQEQEWILLHWLRLYMVSSRFDDYLSQIFDFIHKKFAFSSFNLNQFSWILLKTSKTFSCVLLGFNFSAKYRLNKQLQSQLHEASYSLLMENSRGSLYPKS